MTTNFKFTKAIPFASAILLGSMTTAANAGVLAPPPPDSTSGLSATVITPPDQSGVVVCIRDDGGGGETVSADFFPLPVATPDCTGATPSVGTLGTSGQLDVNNAPGVGNVFAGAIGTTGAVADFALPYFGITTPAGLPLGIGVTGTFLTPLVSYAGTGTLGALDSVDTFTAETIDTVKFATVGNTTESSFVFSGYWNIETSPGVIEQFDGQVSLTDTFVGQTVDVSEAEARSAVGFVTSFSGSVNVIAERTPEPASLGGLAMGIASMIMLGKKKKS